MEFKMSQSNNNAGEKRTASRVTLEAPIKLTNQDGVDYFVNSYDFSDTGLFVGLEELSANEFPIGTLLQVQYQELSYEAPVVRGEVVRHANGGIGIHFEGK
jgi:hypothetical protein